MGDHPMESSDEEGEISPNCVIDYHCVDEMNEPISFHFLPHKWTEDEIPEGSNTKIFLHGTAETGDKIYQNIIAWKLELCYTLPEIYALSSKKTWIKLQRPRRSFEYAFKTIFITVHCLHFLKRNPEANASFLWVHLRKAFSSYEVEPSENHLLYHVDFIKEAAVRDKDIANSEFLSDLLLKAQKPDASYEENHTTKKPNFIVDMYDEDDDDVDRECDDEEDLMFDSVCVLGDNGGEILCCEDKCLRSFHPNVVAGADSSCEALGYNNAQIEAIQKFICNNCQYQQHQCFVCGILGSSNLSSIPEVFQCTNANCGYFYHPDCVAELLHPFDKSKSEELISKICSGESFACPAHKCTVCKKGEDKSVYDLQFAVCRRCPKSYHRKCLPRKIAFESDADNGIHERAWDGLLLSRILIYCMDHEIIPEIGTPKRNHILFPNVDGKRQTNSGLLSSTEKVIQSRVAGNFTQTQMQAPRTGDAYGCNNSKAGRGDTRKFTSGRGVTINSLGHKNKIIDSKVYMTSNMDNKFSLGNNLPYSPLRTNYLPKSSQISSLHVKQKLQNNQTVTKNLIKKVNSNQPPLDAEMKTRILKLMQDSTSSFNVDEFLKNQKASSTASLSSRVLEDKTFTEGKVEGYVKAVYEAWKILERGGTVEDAKAVCEPQVLNQLVRWKTMLAVYLSPFLHGNRYTSFGRHFTKKDKLTEKLKPCHAGGKSVKKLNLNGQTLRYVLRLKQKIGKERISKKIVNKLKWYVQNGDTIVDFSCGSNDFSWIMKDELHKMGTKCSFRNYDLIAPKNDFSFEQRDWMSVDLKELPAGSNLIMGLNPPFGVNAYLANKFIDKALSFEPKLLILIVPKETRRLDTRKRPYDLIWEDDQILSGKSFYLPGSVNVNNEPLEQWNFSTPPLYLWSRRDWTTVHRSIAENCGHMRKKPLHSQKRGNDEGIVSNHLLEENRTPSGHCEFGWRQSIDNPHGTKMEPNWTSQTGEMLAENKIGDMCVDMELEHSTNSATNRFQSTQYAPTSQYTAIRPDAANSTGYLHNQMYGTDFSQFTTPYGWPTRPDHYFDNVSFYPRGPGF